MVKILPYSILILRILSQVKDTFIFSNALRKYVYGWIDWLIVNFGEYVVSTLSEKNVSDTQPQVILSNRIIQHTDKCLPWASCSDGEKKSDSRLLVGNSTWGVGVR